MQVHWTVMALSHVDGVRAGKAVEEVVDGAIFLHDDDDVLDLLALECVKLRETARLQIDRRRDGGGSDKHGKRDGKQRRGGTETHWEAGTPWRYNAERREP